MASGCTHIELAQAVPKPGRVCEECVKTGDTWVHLRQCLVCGKVGCCDSSKNKHATRHFHDSKHPIMRSAQPGEHWIWCYIDEDIVGDDRQLAA